MNGLPDEVRRFLHRCIDSVEELEVLLHARQTPGRSWSAEDMARELYSHPNAIARRFERLLAAGLIREFTSLACALLLLRSYSARVSDTR